MKRLFTVMLVVVVASGCMAWRVTDPPRTAVEQLLLSTAVDRAVSQLNLPTVRGKAVYLDVEKLEAVDKSYIVAALHEHLGDRLGAFIFSSAEGAEVIVEARSGGLGIDKFHFMVGLPSISLPVPETLGSISTPEIPLIIKERQNSIAKLGLFARYIDGQSLGATGMKSGHAYFNTWIFLFIPFETTDLPGKRVKIKKAREALSLEEALTMPTREGNK